MTDTGLRYEAAPERRAWILSTLQSIGFLSVADLARQLGVSQMTIRRDLHALEDGGHVRLVHGGASVTPGALRASDLPEDDNAEARDRVARYAVGLVGEGESIAIDAGTIGYLIARALPDDFRGCVISHSMPVLQQLTAGRSHRVVALGGELLPDRHAFAGPSTETAVAQLRVGTFFLSPSGLDARGMYAQSPAEARVLRQLMDYADLVVLVTKIEVFSLLVPSFIVS